MPKLSIRAKLSVILLALTGTLVGACLTVAVINWNERAALSDAEKQTGSLATDLIPLLGAVRDMQVDVIQVQQFLTDAAATHNSDSFGDAAKYYKDFGTQSALAKTLIAKTDRPGEAARTGGLADELAAIATQLKTFDETGQAMAHVYITSGTEAGNLLMAKFDPMSDALFHRLDALVAATRHLIDDYGKAAIHEVAEARNVASLLAELVALWAGIGLAVVFVAFSVVIKGVTRPMMRLTEAMEGLARNDLQIAVPGVERVDEIGMMATAVQVFKDNGLALQASQGEAASQRGLVEQERAANEAGRADSQRQQQAVVATIAAGLDRMSKGDLTSRLTQTFTQDYEKLRSDFNATVDSLQEALRTIAKATEGISTGSDEIATASDNLAHRTEQQAASLEQTAAALSVITETVKKMSSGAGEAAQVVGMTRLEAETSGEIVEQAVEAMGRIKDSSNKISQIVGVIDEIAFQTNLLALNAGVEAARAGDAGRGFAVVASEVRGLAQRSAEAAREIKALIATSTEQVDGGVVLVGKTGDALRGIIDKVAMMDTLVREISAQSQEQATSLGEVNTAVTQMDKVVQQNATMVEESTAAAHALKGETQELTTIVGRFQIEDAGVSRVRRPEAPRRQVKRVAA